MSTYEQMPEVMPLKREDYEMWIIERSTEFSVVRFLGKGEKDRKDFPTLTDAVADAEINPRAMVYASMKSGRSTMVARTAWCAALKVVGSKA